MSTEVAFNNARIVLDDRVINGSLCVIAGRITSIDSGTADLASAVDCQGDYLLPGLVELHTDNLEKHFAPRPGVRWPAMAAVLGHDAQIAAAGITTVFDAVALGDFREGRERLANLDATVQTLTAAHEQKTLRADHRLHLRCEVNDPGCLEYYRALSSNPLVELVSVMDHTPGQRQFVSMDAFRTYYQNRHGLSDEEFAEFHQRGLEAQQKYSAPNRRAIVALVKEHGYCLASHDDATPEHIAEAIADGVSIAEFPTTREAAHAARAGGLAMLLGAPNVLLGGSHSGNISALALAREDLLDILSSDYVPSASLQAAFQLVREAEIALPAAIAKVTKNPARAVGLNDRGVIAIGLRADLVRVREIDGLPLVRGAWREGLRVV